MQRILGSALQSRVGLSDTPVQRGMAHSVGLGSLRVSFSSALISASCMDGRNELPFFEGYLRENNPERLDNSECQVFQARYASIFHDDSVPHMICDVADTTVAGPETLRSEIVTGITLIKRQLRSLRFADHHIIPVGLVSRPSHVAATDANQPPRRF